MENFIVQPIYSQMAQMLLQPTGMVELVCSIPGMEEVQNPSPVMDPAVLQQIRLDSVKELPTVITSMAPYWSREAVVPVEHPFRDLVQGEVLYN